MTEYFSYEHFYVVFCRFYELDADRDGRLSGEDLMKYGEHGLSSLIVDRYTWLYHTRFPCKPVVVKAKAINLRSLRRVSIARVHAKVSPFCRGMVLFPMV